jgi:hypothetical protein
VFASPRCDISRLTSLPLAGRLCVLLGVDGRTALFIFEPPPVHVFALEDETLRRRPGRARHA